MLQKISCFTLLIGMSVFISSCQQKYDSVGSIETVTAAAPMKAKSGSSVKGLITLEQKTHGVVLNLNLSGFPKNSTHAFHVHKKGDCSAKDATSAGGHFNPDGHKHGSPQDEMSHAGDMGNIKSDGNGVIELTVINPNITLENDKENSVLDRALIIHADRDHFDKQPSGNAGKRIACGVIQAVK